MYAQIQSWMVKTQFLSLIIMNLLIVEIRGFCCAYLFSVIVERQTLTIRRSTCHSLR